MRQDRASRTPRQCRATTERRPAAEAEARQANSSSHARVEHRQSIVSCFPRSTRPPITSSTTPSPSHSGARARTRDNQSRATRTERRQGRQTRGGAQPPEAVAPRRSEQQASTTTRPGRRPPTTAQEDRARRPSIPSDPSQGRPAPGGRERGAPAAEQAAKEEGPPPKRTAGPRKQGTPRASW